MFSAADVGEHAQLRPHELQQLEQAGTRGIHPDIRESHRPLGRQRCGDEKEGRRREIRRYRDGGGAQRLSALECDHRTLLSKVHTEGTQHALGVIPRGRRLRELSTSARGESGEKERGLHLRARHRQRVLDARELWGAVNHDRRAAAVRVDACTHAAQRLGNALHGPPHQRLIANQRRIEARRCEQPHHEAHGRAGITHIERCRGCAQPAGTPAPHPDFGLCRPLDGHTERGEGACSCQAVLAREEAADTRLPLRERTEHQGAVRDRLVTRDGEGAGDSAAGCDTPAARRCSAHCTARG